MPTFWVGGRLYGSYPETVFEEVIEAIRRRTWTINALFIQLTVTGISVRRRIIVGSSIPTRPSAGRS